MSGEEMKCSRRGCSCGGFVHPGVPVRSTDLGLEILNAEKRLERLYRRAEAMNEWGSALDYEDGTVLLLERVYDGNPMVYSFAAIKAGGLWFVTGARAGADGIAHTRFVEEHLIPAQGVWVVTEAEEL